MKWQASAPTNIALIKYMGKIAGAGNVPTNASLSYTLDHLKSFVELEFNEHLVKDCWEPLQQPEANFIPELNQTAQERFIKHLAFIKKHFNFNGYFVIRSANNFPAGCGLASSASSFAALTLCAVQALTELTSSNPLNVTEIADLSRQGSGSSCRSFFSPWALWEKDSVHAINFPYQQLLHMVVVVSKEHKAIGSSEAHRRVATSSLFPGRVERAQQRLQALMQNFKEQNWQAAYQVVWQEFWDMHALFETAAEPFNYLQPGSMAVLDYIQNYWENVKDGPLVTLDAGPNVHLLFRVDQKKIMEEINRVLAKDFLIL